MDAASTTTLGLGACLLGAFVCWYLGVYHLLKTLAGVRPEQRWARFGPFTMLMPSMLTAEGNAHRVRMLRAAGLFMLFAALALVLSGAFAGMAA